MGNIEVASMSSRGQIVIPQELRKKLRIEIGEKFVVLGKDDTIILKKLEIPSFKGFEKLLKETREFIKEKNIKESSVEEVIKKHKKIISRTS